MHKTRDILQEINNKFYESKMKDYRVCLKKIYEEFKVFLRTNT